jgi:hypothetical protein
MRKLGYISKTSDNISSTGDLNQGPSRTDKGVIKLPDENHDNTDEGRRFVNKLLC